MSGTRLLYFDSETLTVYQASSSSITKIRSYKADMFGLAAFSQDIAKASDETYCLLAELLEENYHTTFIPFVKGRQRQALLQRRLSKAFPSTNYRLPLSIGFEKAKRLDEKLLLVALTNTESIDIWLNILEENHAQVAGLYSTSLLVPELIKDLGKLSDWTMAIFFSSAGMHLTLCENNALRFSRLIVPPSFDPIDLADFCATETTKTIEYLLTVRILPKSLPQISVLVIAPEIDIAIFEQALLPTLSLKPQFISIEACSTISGLRHYVQTGLSDQLFCYILFQKKPAIQFAPPSKLQHFRLGHLKRLLTRLTATIVTLCLAFCFYQAINGLNKYQQQQQLKTQNTKQSKCTGSGSDSPCCFGRAEKHR